MQTESLKNKTIKGTFWSAADAFLGQGITFIVGIILARLLSPEEYGLIGICLVFNTVLNGIVDSGFSNALIRKKEVSEADYNTMFITNLLVSFVLYALLYILSPAISSFFERSELVKLLRLTGLVLFTNALSIVQVTILTKKIDFKTKTKASLISAFVSGLVGIVLAYYGFGVWALVGQLLTKQLLYTIALWFFNEWFPKFTFRKNSFFYMWNFGWKLLLSGILNNIWNQLYQIVVAKFYSPSVLGQYTRSREYANIFSFNLTTIIQRVTFPVLSEIQEDRPRMIEAYRKVIKITMFITACCMICLAAISEPLIYCLIGSQWKTAATFLPLICIQMSLYPLHAINLNMLQVLNRSDIYLKIEIIKKILYIIPIVIGIFISIYWMLIASIFIGIISLYLNSWYIGKTLKYTFIRQIRDIIPSYLIATTTALIIFMFKFFFSNYWIVLPIQIVSGFFIIISIGEYLKLREYVELKEMIIKRLFL